MIIQEATGKEFLSKVAPSKIKTKALRAQKYWSVKLPILKDLALDKALIEDLASASVQFEVPVSFLVLAALLQSASTTSGSSIKAKTEELALTKGAILQQAFSE